ncbi:MAG: GNAT family N-acetyltransferase [Chloroflexota bacterium]
MQSDILALEQMGLRAWRTLESESYDGWTLRFAEGHTRRANSVQSLSDSSLPLNEKLAYCEAWYAERNQPCIFRVADVMFPPDLDQFLADHNYQKDAETITKTRLLDEPLVMDTQFHYDTSLTDSWLSAWGKWEHVPDEKLVTAQKIIASQTLPSCYGWIDNVAVGLAIIDGDTVGLYNIVVDENARQQGYGRALLTSLLAWAQDNGTTKSYLQVLGTNQPARTLYHCMGYQPHHRYWYRKQAISSEA